MVEKFPVDLKCNTNDISFSLCNEFALVISDNPSTANIINLKNKTLQDRIEVLYKNDGTHTERGHIVDHPGLPDKFIVCWSFEHSINIYTWNFQLLYQVPNDGMRRWKSE